MSNIEPTIRLEQDGVFTRATMEYGPDALDAMAQRAAERIEDELAQQLLAQLGYVKPVRCRDCEHCHEHDMRAYGGGCDQLLCHHFSMSSGAGWPVKPDGFCAWGKRKEVAE